VVGERTLCCSFWSDSWRMRSDTLRLRSTFSSSSVPFPPSPCFALPLMGEPLMGEALYISYRLPWVSACARLYARATWNAAVLSVCERSCRLGQGGLSHGDEFSSGRVVSVAALSVESYAAG
jgi:hypothetical protein